LGKGQIFGVLGRAVGAQLVMALMYADIDERWHQQREASKEVPGNLKTRQAALTLVADFVKKA
jgi:hypothetical protein